MAKAEDGCSTLVLSSLLLSSYSLQMCYYQPFDNRDNDIYTALFLDLLARSGTRVVRSTIYLADASANAH